MKITAVMVTCPERSAVRQQTLANLGATDWGEDLTVVVDQGSGPNRIAPTVNVPRVQGRSSQCSRDYKARAATTATAISLFTLKSDPMGSLQVRPKSDWHAPPCAFCLDVTTGREGLS